jgi:hypothetical protein
MTHAALVIAERDAEWADWVHELSKQNERVVVLVQEPAEDRQAFAARVSDRIGDLTIDDAQIDSAAFVGNASCDEPSQDNRSRILRRLATALAVGGKKAQLFLDPTVRARGKRPYQLMRALAWALADAVHGSSLSIAVGGVELSHRPLLT